MPALLTIGIPTFDRPAELERLLKAIKSFRLQDQVEVLVIDDHPAHAGAEAVRASGLEVRYLANQQNLGFPRSLIRLLESCQTPYLMLMADDEELEGRGILALLRYLDARHPDFVSPRWLRRRRMPKGRVRGVRRTRPIKPEEVLRAAGHAPGLVFSIPAVLGHLAALEARISRGCSLAATYPQVILLFEILASGSQSAFYLATATGTHGATRASNIRDQEGASYWSLDSRLRQFRDLSGYLQSMPASDLRARLISGARKTAAARVLRASRTEGL